MWVLDVISSTSNIVETSFHLIAGEWSLGRKKCNFNFHSDTSISRKHAIIRVSSLSQEQLSEINTRPLLILIDQNSRFGSFVNQQQCFNETILHHGDEVTFGAKRTILRVRYQVFILIPSRINKPNRKKFQETCQRLGMHVISQSQKKLQEATHCIMDPGRIAATEKVLWALVYNQPVVCTTWVYAILERKSLDEPLPRCEGFLPSDDGVPVDVASNYLPNPKRKTLFLKYTFVFLSPQSMEEILIAMGGKTVRAYTDESENDEQLLQNIQTHIEASRNVLIIEPPASLYQTQHTQVGGSASGIAASCASASVHGPNTLTREISTSLLANVERRMQLLKSMEAPFITIQELAASVIFAKISSSIEQSVASNSFINSFNNQYSTAPIRLSSFPENLRLVPTTPDADESQNIKPEVNNEEVVNPSALHTPSFDIKTDVSGLTRSKSSEKISTDAEMKSENAIQNTKTRKPVYQRRTYKENRYLTYEHDNSQHEEPHETDNIKVEVGEPVNCHSGSILDLMDNIKPEYTGSLVDEQFSTKETESTQSSNNWIPCLSGQIRPHDMIQDDKNEFAEPIVEHTSLVVRVEERYGDSAASIQSQTPEQHHSNGINYKRFKKGNQYMPMFLPGAGERKLRANGNIDQRAIVTVVPYTENNTNTLYNESARKDIEDQERIAEELFAVVEKRTARIKFS